MIEQYINTLNDIKSEVYGHGRTEHLVDDMINFCTSWEQDQTSQSPDSLLAMYIKVVADILHIYADKQDQRYLVSMNRDILKELILLNDKIVETVIEQTIDSNPNFEAIIHTEQFLKAKAEAHKLTDGYLHKK